MTPITSRIKENHRENARTCTRAPCHEVHGSICRPRKVEVLKRQRAAQQNGASTHVEQPTLYADTQHSTSVKCKNCSKIQTKLPLTASLVSRDAFTVQAATLASSFCCSFSRETFVSDILSVLLNLLPQCFCFFHTAGLAPPHPCSSLGAARRSQELVLDTLVASLSFWSWKLLFPYVNLTSQSQWFLLGLT